MEHAFTPGRPWQSRLIPYEKEILELRRRRPPVPFSQIVTHLSDRYGIKVHLDTIHNFVKVRAGLYRDHFRPQPSRPSAPSKPTTPVSPIPSSAWDSLSTENGVLIPNPKKGTNEHRQNNQETS
jgi:hypothetical protein